MSRPIFRSEAGCPGALGYADSLAQLNTPVDELDLCHVRCHGMFPDVPGTKRKRGG